MALARSNGAGAIEWRWRIRCALPRSLAWAGCAMASVGAFGAFEALADS